ncbi:tonB-system energizer ExbB [Caulobacter radicis]|uniref:tonB-system energizer ExbB n=1 Tax=Caulobacter radicis TaxID=2172650 RepID=UPI00140389AC|nr:tonB-system energizer ExbB [Caulobacter radicis]
MIRTWWLGPCVAWTPWPAAAAVLGAPPSDLSITAMFAAADPVVKIVMILLLAASLTAWTIFIAKLAQIASARKRLDADLNILEAAVTLGAVDQVRHPSVVMMIELARSEMDRAPDLGAPGAVDSLKSRYATRLLSVTSGSVQAMAAGLSMLAIIGSTGPFVGLAGTVWGIMNSFIGIAKSHTTSLAVVAPGIAEALLATAMGLTAAIPAVLFYNVLARALAGYRRQVVEASGLASCLLSLELDTRLAAGAHEGGGLPGRV